MPDPTPAEIRHEPILLPVLTGPDCAVEACTHRGDCPTRGAVACQACTETDPVVGMVARVEPWPCLKHREEQRRG